MFALWQPTHGCAAVEDVQISVCALMRTWSRPRGRRLSGKWVALSGLTWLHAINRIIACSLICNRNLACGEDTRLDCCDVIATTGDYGMAIITLGRLYFVLSCRLAPIVALYVQYGQRAGSGVTCILTGPHLSSGVDSKVIWVRLLVDFWCEDTCHMGSPDPSSDQDRTYP
jgi:hypothetical protein